MKAVVAAPTGSTAPGFSMNMLSTVYSLMPFEPMDGGRIFGWSKLLWAFIFIPLLLFYLVMLVFIL
jgi:hypothetical protein